MEDKEKSMFAKFLKVEMKRINVKKWIKGEKIKADPGEEYIVEWIKKNGADFRKAWDSSKCKVCRFWDDCGYHVISICEEFENE